MARTSNFANVATVTRASTKTDAGGWDFTNGGTVGTLTEYASGVAAIHPTAGLLVEESTTNEIRNPRCEGAVVGVPGTLPTNWSTIYPGGQEIVGFGTEDGTPYCDVRYNGTPTANFTIQFDVSNFIVAASGEDWALSLGLKLVGGDFSNLDFVRLRMGWSTSVPSFISYNDSADISGDIDATHKRFWHTVNAPATTGFVNHQLFFDYSGSGAVDFTLRIYAPQIEQKAYPTSPVLPVVSSPAAATRAADYVTLSLGAWFNELAGTMFFEYQSNTAGVSGKVVGGFGDTFNNTLYIGQSGTGTRWSGDVRSGAATSATLTPSGQSDYAVGTSYKAAIAYTQDDFAMSLSGATQATDTAGNVPVSPTRFVVGGAPWSASAGNIFNGYIKDLRYWPKRLTNAEREALVGN